VQDTFLAVWREAGTYRGGGDVAAFIWGIGVRRLIDALRREKGARRGLPGRAAQSEVVRRHRRRPGPDLCGNARPLAPLPATRYPHGRPDSH
jgi:DNA-directed RNA polymerase specialized sigma24 family protein